MIVTIAYLNISCESKQTKHSADLSNETSNSGKVIGIIDGDTYDILLDGDKTVRIRMEGIDAPEKGMPFYRKAKKHLSDLCYGKIVRLEIHTTDEHDRKIAFSYLEDGRELSHEMIKAGLAWHFVKFNKDSDLAELESQAKKAKRGLWVDNSPMPPWENRSLHRNGVSTKDSFDIKDGEQ